MFEVSECHLWFNKAVARWLDIALYKAMQRIIKVTRLFSKCNKQKTELFPSLWKKFLVRTTN